MKTPRLSKSGIDYLDLAWNFYSGCLNGQNGVCPLGKNCWAMKRTQRFKHLYPRGFEPTFYIDAFLSPMNCKKPSIIGVAFMGDLLGDWINPDEETNIALYGLDNKSIKLVKIGINPVPKFPLKKAIYSTIECCHQHTFLFLTKCPWNLLKWSPFPPNCWVGVSATDSTMFAAAYYHLKDIEAKTKYISIEPLLEWDERVTKAMIHQASQAGVNWIILGAQTKPYKPPKVEWVEDIVMACIEAHIPVWLKDNLVKALPPTIPFYVPPLEVPEKGRIKIWYRQEFPL